MDDMKRYLKKQTCLLFEFLSVGTCYTENFDSEAVLIP